MIMDLQDANTREQSNETRSFHYEGFRKTVDVKEWEIEAALNGSLTPTQTREVLAAVLEQRDAFRPTLYRGFTIIPLNRRLEIYHPDNTRLISSANKEEAIDFIDTYLNPKVNW